MGLSIISSASNDMKRCLPLLLLLALSCSGRGGMPVASDGLPVEGSVILHRIITDDGTSVTAGDGMASVGLPDGRSVFLMGDSFFCRTEGKVMKGADHMYRNTYIIYDPRARKASGIRDGAGEKTSAAVPPGSPDEAEWYWPGHGFAEGDTLYIFQYKMYQKSPGAWGFAYDCTHLLAYHLPEMSLVRDEKILYDPSSEEHTHVYGVATLKSGEYQYIYSQVEVRGGLDPVSGSTVARVRPDGIWGPWEYWTGSAWSADASDAALMDGLTQIPLSSQFSVFPLRGKYVLLSEHKTLWVSEIWTFVSDTPYGPWRNGRKVYDIPASDDKNLFYYNAMAHPQLSTRKALLVSYDVNTQDFFSIFKNVDNYRPRFVWIPVKRILE